LRMLIAETSTMIKHTSTNARALQRENKLGIHFEYTRVLIVLSRMIVLSSLLSFTLKSTLLGYLRNVRHIVDIYMVFIEPLSSCLRRWLTRSTPRCPWSNRPLI
jgi:hypothetical protein